MYSSHVSTKQLRNKYNRADSSARQQQIRNNRTIEVASRSRSRFESMGMSAFEPSMDIKPRSTNFSVGGAYGQYKRGVYRQ